MKANELRIGNWVIDIFDIKNPIERQIDLDDLSMFKNYTQHPLPFNPIPITEEWVSKSIVASKGVFNIALADDDFVNNCYSIRYERIYVKIKYVHQLQNLYFALIGEEL